MTGAGQGIGRATALELARDGYIVVLADIVHERTENVMLEIREAGSDGLVLDTDVSSVDAVRHMIDTAIESFGRVDVLVNNAGTHVSESVTDLTDQTLDTIIDTNLKSVFYSCRAVIPAMMAQNSGAIVNISSVWAWACAPNAAPYCASKAGIMALTKSLAIEVGPYGIRVNAIAPGLIETELHRSATSQEDQEKHNEQVPLGRMGLPEEIARPIRFLVSDDASWITGETLTVSGGSYLR